MRMLKLRRHGKGLDPVVRVCAECKRLFHPQRRARDKQSFCSNACRLRLKKKHLGNTRVKAKAWFEHNTRFWLDVSGFARASIEELDNLSSAGCDLIYLRRVNDRRIRRLMETFLLKRQINGFQRAPRRSHGGSGIP